MENMDIKEEYIEPNVIGQLVKREPLDIKCERVSMKEEYVERNKFDGFSKGEIGQANDVKEEYVEYESSNAIKTEADESLIKKEFAKKSFVEAFSTDCVRVAKKDKSR